MDSNSEIVASLRHNLKRIIQLYEAQKEDNKSLREQNETLNRQIARLKSQQNELETSSNSMQLTQAFITASGGSSHDAKLKVNRIVREIDKCIALLNK